jgi:hypothetical protein
MVALAQWRGATVLALHMQNEWSQWLAEETLWARQSVHFGPCLSIARRFARITVIG